MNDKIRRRRCDVSYHQPLTVEAQSVSEALDTNVTVTRVTEMSHSDMIFLPSHKCFYNPYAPA